jgi:carboxylesterase
VGGLSMGGSLVLRLAADHPAEVDGIVLVNAAIIRPRKDELAVPLLKWVIPSMPGITNDIKKPDTVEYGYTRTPLRAAHSMMSSWKLLRTDLAKVTAPILSFRSSIDHVVDPASARVIAAAVSSRDITEQILEDSYHVATLDNDAPTIFEGSAEFIARVTSEQ